MGQARPKQIQAWPNFRLDRTDLGPGWGSSDPIRPFIQSGQAGPSFRPLPRSPTPAQLLIEPKIKVQSQPMNTPVVSHLANFGLN